MELCERLPTKALLAWYKGEEKKIEEKKMSPEDKLQKVLEYAGHRSVCDALGVNWRQGPCDCGRSKQS